jgi:hypothetical protein
VDGMSLSVLAAVTRPLMTVHDSSAQYDQQFEQGDGSNQTEGDRRVVHHCLRGGIIFSIEGAFATGER